MKTNHGHLALHILIILLLIFIFVLIDNPVSKQFVLSTHEGKFVLPKNFVTH